MRRAALMLGLLCLIGCGGMGNGPPVELVVPTGFTGTVYLPLDAAGSDIPLVNGRYQIVVPADGVLRVRSYQPLQEWHSFSARYKDGTLIPWDHSSDSGVLPDAVAVRGSGFIGGERDGRKYQYHWFFVGTAKQETEMRFDRQNEPPGSKQKHAGPAPAPDRDG